jgi:glucokinase
MYLLTGDIGGTNSRMALYDVNAETPLVVKEYRNAMHIPKESYSDPNVFPHRIVRPFLEFCWNELEGGLLPPLNSQVQIIATFAIAGFVLNNQVHLTNLGSMLVDGTAIATKYKKDPYLKHIVLCRIINDFVAVRIQICVIYHAISYLDLTIITRTFSCTARIRMPHLKAARSTETLWPH